MAQLILAGRTDLDEFFKQSGILDYDKVSHTPFLAFVTADDVTTVRIIESATALLTLPDETPIICQWRGEWRSDFFQFKVADVRHFLDLKNMPLKSARSVIKRIGPKGGFRSLSYEYVDSSGRLCHITTVLKSEAERLEALFYQNNIKIEIQIL